MERPKIVPGTFQVWIEPEAHSRHDGSILTIHKPWASAAHSFGDLTEAQLAEIAVTIVTYLAQKAIAREKVSDDR